LHIVLLNREHIDFHERKTVELDGLPDVYYFDCL